jgi:predicted nucleic acid-binding protein
MVLDANIFVRLAAPTDYVEQTEALWLRVAVGGEPCVVPAFCSTEVISSLRQMGRGQLLTPDEEAEAVERFTSRIQPLLVTVESPVLTRLAWQIARDLGERHTYDSVYLAVARAFGMEFWTADQRLLRALAGRFPQARFLGDYPLPPPAA